ncbi:MAG: AAA family ATPase [Patescibacteria group bacterium]
MDAPPAELVEKCPTCQGFGGLKNQRGALVGCPTCHGVGVAVWWAGRWWSWLHPISTQSILERHLERTVKSLLSALIFVFALTGLFFGGRRLFEAIADGEVWNVLLTPSWPMAVLWLGLLCAMYLVYRLERDLTMFPTIPTATPADPPAPDWNEQSMGDIAAVSNEATLRVIEHAWRMAKGHRREGLSPLHLLAALSATREVESMLVRLMVPASELRQHIDQLVGQLPAMSAVPVFTAASRELLARAFRLAAADRRSRLTPAYLLAAMGTVDDPARELLDEFSVDVRRLEQATAWLLVQEDLRRRVRSYLRRAANKPQGAIDRGYVAAATPTLDRYSVDLTLRASRNRLPYVVGRDEELQTIFRIMESGRRSVMLVGDGGVGKTYLLYALAERMAAEDVPEPLQDKRLVALSAAALVAGSGQLEQRLEAILNEIIRSGNIILVIENIDQLVGISSTGGQGLDAAQMVAQELEQHAFLAIGTTDPASYRRALEHGPLLSAFEKVEVNEMPPEQALVVIESRLGPLEAHHQVYFTLEAIDKAVELTRRYLHERPLPGSALDVLEQAAVLARKSRGPNGLVVGEDVATIVSEQGHVKATAVTSDEQGKLLHLEEELHRRVVGQDEAVKAVANALRRARAELRDNKRPIANLLFLGPTGVGKTELAKTVAAVYFGSEEVMIRLDMSEYQDVASIHRLIGAPPGYAGSSAGYLTEAVRQRPFSLVLLDELEKAHPDVLNVFLQVMDDGRLTDGNGRTIDFTNVILIATSNAGTQHIQDRMRDGAALSTIKDELINRELSQYFRPEFLNRFDSIIVFTPLSPIEVNKIVGLMMNDITDRLGRKGITFRATPEAMAELAISGFDPLFGARPLRRAVQEHVDNALAQSMLQGKLGRRDVAVLEPGGIIRVEKAASV